MQVMRLVTGICLALLLPASNLLAQDEDPAPAPTGTPREMVAKAEAGELSGHFAGALKLREAALAGFTEALTVRHEMIAHARSRAADAQVSDDNRAIAGAWANMLAAESARIDAERVRCEYWIAELKKPKFGRVPKLRRERGILWTHEAEINDAVAKLRQLEESGKWDRADSARQHVSILCKSKRRYVVARIDALERTLKSLSRNRKLKDTEVVTLMEGQIAFWNEALKWMEARIERNAAERKAEEDPVAGDLRARVWRALSDQAAALAIPDAALPSAAERTRLADAEAARAAYYRAEAAQRAEREKEEEGSDK